MFKLTLNHADVKRIQVKLDKLTHINEPSSLVYQYRLKILNDYVEVVTDLMGRVSADGGFVTCYFLGDTATANWKALSGITKKLKASNNWKAEIWEATGATRKAVLQSIEQSGNTFAGVIGTDGSDNDPLVHAKTSEELGRYLFSMVNDIFAKNKSRIEHEIFNLIKHDLSWGSK